MRVLQPFRSASMQVIHIVNRSHHLAAIKCEATNDIGSNEASMVLTVKCK